MRYYNHDKDGPSILNLDESNPLGFPRLNEASWRNFVFRKENMGGRYFLVEKTAGLIETLICVSIKSSPVFRSSAYISIYGALDGLILSSALSFEVDPELRVALPALRYAAGNRWHLARSKAGVEREGPLCS